MTSDICSVIRYVGILSSVSKITVPETKNHKSETAQILGKWKLTHNFVEFVVPCSVKPNIFTNFHTTVCFVWNIFPFELNPLM